MFDAAADGIDDRPGRPRVCRHVGIGLRFSRLLGATTGAGHPGDDDVDVSLCRRPGDGGGRKEPAHRGDDRTGYDDDQRGEAAIGGRIMESRRGTDAEPVDPVRRGLCRAFRAMAGPGRRVARACGRHVPRRRLSSDRGCAGGGFEIPWLPVVGHDAPGGDGRERGVLQGDGVAVPVADLDQIVQRCRRGDVPGGGRWFGRTCADVGVANVDAAASTGRGTAINTFRHPRNCVMTLGHDRDQP